MVTGEPLWTVRPFLRISCPALLRQEFNAPPIELRSTGLPEQLVGGMCSKQDHQGGLVHAGAGRVGQARLPRRHTRTAVAPTQVASAAESSK